MNVTCMSIVANLDILSKFLGFSTHTLGFFGGLKMSLRKTTLFFKPLFYANIKDK